MLNMGYIRLVLREREGGGGEEREEKEREGEKWGNKKLFRYFLGE